MRNLSILVAALALLFLAGAATAQAPPTSAVTFQVPALYLSAPSSLANSTAAATAGPCGTSVTTTDPTGDGQFTAAADLVPGSYFPMQGVAITGFIHFDGPPATGGQNQAPLTTGFQLTVTLLFGGTPVATQTKTVGDQTAAFTEPFSLDPASNESANETIRLDVAMVGEAGGAHNFQIACGEQSFINTFQVYRGQPGDGDIDGDLAPDSEDEDMDGDGASNAEEQAVQCVIGGNTVDFSRDPALRPGPESDGDRDSYSDEAECAAGTDPGSASDYPPLPEPFPWALIIFLALVVILVAAVVFYFMTYGKGAAVSVLSAAQLVIPPGTQGKFEIRVKNLAKKGNPTTFQLSAAGMPDGWDAKLSSDHAVLDPEGGVKNLETVWLTVEAPQHADPESAVIAVKAIPLNKAGRKDSKKLPARAKTITSINVPPNAKVPVKRGAPVKLKSEKELAKESAAQAPSDVAPTAVPETAPTPTKGKKKGKEEKIPVTPTPPPTPPPAAAAKPQLQVGGLAHEPPAFKKGESVKSMVTVTNNGSDPQTLKLSLFVNESLADAQTVSVKPGKAKEVKFKWVAQERNKLNIRGELVAG